MRLSVAVQHHPKRADLLPVLLEGLAPAEVDVVCDPEPGSSPSAWRSYRACLETTPAWATHRVVIQDDSRLCASFAEVLERAIAAQPDRLAVLCVCGQPSTSANRILRASWRGHSWAILDPARWVPVIALVWPVRLIRPALEFVDAQNWTPAFCADDEIVGRIARTLREQVLATVPSLVQHDDLVPSLVGLRAAGGRNPGRVAACFAGDSDDCDPLSIDWTQGP